MTDIPVQVAESFRIVLIHIGFVLGGIVQGIGMQGVRRQGFLQIVPYLLHVFAHHDTFEEKVFRIVRLHLQERIHIGTGTYHAFQLQ